MRRLRRSPLRTPLPARRRAMQQEEPIWEFAGRSFTEEKCGG